MEKFIENVIIVLGVFVVSIIVACLGGFVIWLLWPLVIPAVFPGLVEAGTIAKAIDLWPAICTVWFFHILQRSNSSTKKKD